MITKPALALLCFITPLLAGADPLDVYGNLTEKTVLMSSVLPRLTDQTAQSSKEFAGLPIWFHTATPLSKSELIYAVETTFTLSHLAIINVKDHKIRPGHIGDVAYGSAK